MVHWLLRWQSPGARAGENLSQTTKVAMDSVGEVGISVSRTKCLLMFAPSCVMF